MTYTKESQKWLEIRANAGYWFAPDTLRFFGSRIYWHTLTETKNGWLFISSEDNFDRTKKLFSVRSVNADYDIDTVGDFLEFDTFAHAKTALKNLSGFSDFLAVVSNA